jgi:trehalose-6-phosphatase
VHIAHWRAIVLPILKQYTSATDGAFIDSKQTSLVWNFRDADPDFGSWQAKELMDHLESVLVNDPVDVFAGNCHVEIKAQGVSKAGTIFFSFNIKAIMPDFIIPPSCRVWWPSSSSLFLVHFHPFPLPPDFPRCPCRPPG